jgi:hypothetical protein
MQRELEIPAAMTPPNFTAISGTLDAMPARVAPSVSLDRVREERTSKNEPRRSQSRRNSNRSTAQQRGAARPNRNRSASRRAS